MWVSTPHLYQLTTFLLVKCHKMRYTSLIKGCKWVQISPLTVTPFRVTPRLEWHFWPFPNHSALKLPTYSDKNSVKVTLLLCHLEMWERGFELCPTWEIGLFWDLRSRRRTVADWKPDRDQIKVFLLSPFRRHFTKTSFHKNVNETKWTKQSERSILGRLSAYRDLPVNSNRVFTERSW